MAIDQVAQRDGHPCRLGEPGPTGVHPAVAPDLSRDLDIGGHQHGRPHGRVEPHDVGPDHVHVGGPGRFVARVGEARDREVVDQRLEPHVHHVGIVVGPRNAPRDPGAAHRDLLVLGPLVDDVVDLVVFRFGLDEIGLGPVQVEQLLSEPADLEEVVGFLDPLDLAGGVRRALSVHEVLVHLECLTAHAVVAGVHTLRDVPSLLDAVEQLLHGPFVPGLGGAYEDVVTDGELFPRSLERRGDPVHPRLRVLSRLLGGLGHLLPVLVHPDREVDILTAQPPVPGHTVGADLLVGVPQVGLAVRVVDCGGDEVLTCHSFRPRPRAGHRCRAGCRAGAPACRGAAAVACAA